jgi:hypothetical protein
MVRMKFDSMLQSVESSKYTAETIGDQQPDGVDLNLVKQVLAQMAHYGVISNGASYTIHHPNSAYIVNLLNMSMSTYMSSGSFQRVSDNDNNASIVYQGDALSVQECLRNINKNIDENNSSSTDVANAIRNFQF